MGNYNANFPYNANIPYNYGYSVLVRMRRLDNTTFSRLKQVQYEGMNDLCNIYHVSYATGTYSTDETAMLTGTFNVECGFVFNNGSFRAFREGQSDPAVLDYDVLLRVPSTQPIFLDDRIELVQKGNSLVSGTFSVASAPVVNSSVQHVLLKRVVS